MIILLIGFGVVVCPLAAGGVFILAGVFVLFALLENNVEYILSISTNAGGNFSIVFESDYFLRKVYDVLY